jgi:2-polyprenyl-6-methoxyphenol hydroxylase-like FAD-dependent oxidoreductase
MDNPDVVVVGAGVAGGAMSTVLARAGLQVLTLEITPEHRDVVRGEFFAPWGVAVAQELGLYDLYMGPAGGIHSTRLVQFDEDMEPAEAQAAAIPMDQLPAPPPICLGHPRLCTVLDEAAVQAGASLLRGVRRMRITPGKRPVVSFEHAGRSHEVRPRLVIGADGRNGPTRQQARIPLHADPMGYWIGGMLVEGAESWPREDVALGTEGWRHLLVFPQGRDRARLYICVKEEHRPLILGSDGPRNILQAFVAKSLPHADAIAGVRPISDPYAYPNNDTWTDQPFTEGVVLIGDAAGHNDPIIGQGLSIAHQDVKLVSQLLTGQDDWSPAAFRPYAEERATRMARLRRAGQFIALREMDLTHDGRARRERIRQRLQHRPEFRNVVIVPLIGPYALPPEAYAEESYRALSR